MGKPEPSNGIIPVPQREILDDITDNLGGAVAIVGDTPDVVIKSRGVVEKLPRELEDFQAFQGAEDVFYHQNSYGNFVHKLRRASGIYALENPYRFMKNDLLTYGVLTSPLDPVFRKLRSTLKTEYVKTDAHGWGDLGDLGILTFEQISVAPRWWADVGRPTAFQIPYDHTGTEGQIYRLLRRNCLVAV